MATQVSPAWLQAMLAQLYPGGSMDTAYSGNPWNKEMYSPPLPAAGGRVPEMQTPIQGVDRRFMPAPASGAGRPAVTANPANSPGGTNTPLPPPDPRRVGGAPSPGIPAPQNFNRTANNPDYPLVQYGVPGSGRGGQNPIYTSHYFGGQPQTPQVPPAPQGALGANTPQATPTQQYGPPMPSAEQMAKLYGWPFNMMGPLHPNAIAGGGIYEPGGSNV